MQGSLIVSGVAMRIVRRIPDGDSFALLGACVFVSACVSFERPPLVHDLD